MKRYRPDLEELRRCTFRPEGCRGPGGVTPDMPLTDEQRIARAAAGLTQNEPRAKPAEPMEALRLTTCLACGATNPTLPERRPARRCMICGERIPRVNL